MKQTLFKRLIKWVVTERVKAYKVPV